MEKNCVVRNYLKQFLLILIVLTLHYIYRHAQLKMFILSTGKILENEPEVISTPLIKIFDRSSHVINIYNTLHTRNIQSVVPTKFFNQSIQNESLTIVKSMQQSISSNQPVSKSKTFKPIILFWTTWYRTTKETFFGYRPSEATTCKIQCRFTTDRKLVDRSHVVLFHGWQGNLLTSKEQVNGTIVYKPADIPAIRHNSQFYVFVISEAPARNEVHLEAYRQFFNWTSSYRSDSDFPVADGKILRLSQPYSYKIDVKLAKRPELVAWMVSSCNAGNNRSELVKQLKQYVPVNIYGKCGERNECKDPRMACYKEIGQTHKFYLSFENSYCKDYVTEKFFLALYANMVPIVFGNADYKRQFPPNSFINVDSFSSPKELAGYLKYLDRNDRAYLKYFDWKKNYYVDPNRQNNEAYCNMCERVYNEYSVKSQTVDVYDWYFGNNSHPICRTPKIKF